MPEKFTKVKRHFLALYLPLRMHNEQFVPASHDAHVRAWRRETRAISMKPVDRDISSGLEICELLYKLVAMLVTFSVVAYAAEMTSSWEVLTISVLLMVVIVLYSALVPLRIARILYPGRDELPRLARVAVAIVLLAFVSFSTMIGQDVTRLAKELVLAVHPDAFAPPVAR